MAETESPLVAVAAPTGDESQTPTIPNSDAEDATAMVTKDTEANASTDLTSTPQPGAKKLVKRKKRRPARPQVDPATLNNSSTLPPQTGTIFNIWYNKWSGGDREDKYLSKHHADGRCSIAKDSGYTRADKVTGSFFCLYFAKGLCPKGHECEYLHRLPTLHDIFNPNVDCFGREKHSDYRDDMGGVGSFMRQNRTLYVGRIHVSDDIEEIVARHFSEWGQIERTRVLNTRGVAFVTYSNEANSQFAKEAMAHQSLDHNEILNVRWATVDPNPMAQAREARRIDEQAAEAVRAALPAEFVAELEGKDPEARKRKRIEGNFGLQGYEAPDDVWYKRIAAQEEEREEEGDRKRLAIEQSEPVHSPADGSGSNGGGILAGRTLAALQGYQAQTNGSSFTSKQPVVPSAGLLVGYGSEDDSD
ncbi:MAG: Pre-mRNA-splicing factor [Chaenotheca gracillima]|nr:MAG: Pre-mRNA-splicing factor [Chaenotheca gracillima]